MTIRALRMAFWLYYDGLGRWTALNLAIVCISAAPLLVIGSTSLLSGWVWSAALAGAGLLLSLGYACVLEAACRGVEGNTITAAVWWQGIRSIGSRLLALQALTFAGLAVGIWLMWFYLAILAPRYPWPAAAACGMVLVAMVLLVAAALLGGPALVYTGAGPLKALIVGAKIVLRYPVLAATMVFTAAMLVALAVFPPIAVLLSVSPIGVLVAATYEMVARREAAGDDVESWRAQCRGWDETDELLNRGFRDFLYPWKS
jgi:hypothetical protein